jgi:hypothetical protein
MRISIGFVDYVDGPPREIWRFELGPTAVDADEVTKELLRLTQELEAGVPFTLDVKRTYLSWGANASAYDVVLMISSVVLSSVAGPLIERKVREIQDRLGKSSDPSDPMTRDRAVSHAKYEVSMSYPVKRSELEVESEDEDRQRGIWSIGLRGKDGSRYAVEIGSANDHPTTYRIKRETS